MREIWDISEKRIAEGRIRENEGIPDLGQKPRETQAFSVWAHRLQRGGKKGERTKGDQEAVNRFVIYSD